MKKIYIGAGVFILMLILITGLGNYRQPKKAEVSPLEQETAVEEESLIKDLDELEKINQDASMDTLEEDLTEITGETAPTAPVLGTEKIDTSSIENLESELSFELNGFTSDFSELDGLESDTSLDDLDMGLSSI